MEKSPHWPLRVFPSCVLCQEGCGSSPVVQRGKEEMGEFSRLQGHGSEPGSVDGLQGPMNLQKFYTKLCEYSGG